MLRRLSLPLALPVAALAALALASSALAGGWAQVTVPNLPTDPPAGEETTIELNVLQHGVTAVSWPKITVIATDATSDATVAAQAKASGPEGHYTAKLTFPIEGEWTLSFVSPELVMQGEVTVSVGPAVVPAVVAAPSSAATAGFDVMPLALVLMLALFAAIAIAAVTMRSREGARAGRVTART
jgi:hypothetical protein